MIDTAPEVDGARAIGYLREAAWALLPVKGPDAGSLLALRLLMDRLNQARGARRLGFLPTMYKDRRGEVRPWLSELQKLADQRVFSSFRRLPVEPGSRGRTTSCSSPRAWMLSASSPRPSIL